MGYEAREWAHMLGCGPNRNGVRLLQRRFHKDIDADRESEFKSTFLQARSGLIWQREVLFPRPASRKAKGLLEKVEPTAPTGMYVAIRLLSHGRL